VSQLAGATRHANTWARWVRGVAGAIATFALTEFLVLAAHLWWHGWNNEFGWISEEHIGLWAFAVGSFHADVVFVSQVAGLAEAADDALTSADWARMGIGAGRGAGRAAGFEFFVVRALHFAVWENGANSTDQVDFFLGVVWWQGTESSNQGLCIAVFRTHTFAVGIFQVSGLTETSRDALEGTEFGFFRFGTVRYTSGSAFQEFFIWTAFSFHRERRDGSSEPEGANAEQQRESKASVHR